MAYPKQQQFMAVAKVTGDGGVIVPVLPMMTGKLATIDPEFAQRWNLGVEMFRVELKVNLDKAIAELKSTA